jgi:DNA-directed RNA polymerase specialized sigma24 family protein
MATGFSEGNDRTKSSRSTADDPRREIYDKQSRRIYSLALWMTNSKNAAQRLASRTFLRAFACGGRVDTEQIDHAFLLEVHEVIAMPAPDPDGVLEAAPETGHRSIHREMKRVDLEKAVAQLPGAERLIFLLHDIEAYDQGRICRLLHFSKAQVLNGLHCARMRIRELVARMQETAERPALPFHISS